ncbi:hypothetical protein VT930_13095 [Mycobacterium sherrisii]|uniref:hypothetical protein n=1 Tax=Mycobacterium sherrisii TaxID=243061 RepID=UPI0012F50A69|nr:hypothetical protein [Mycobacterium sherrisii]MEC4764037.1 hypothetical protein [Mycobacterium sherrisii]
MLDCTVRSLGAACGGAAVLVLGLGAAGGMTTSPSYATAPAAPIVPAAPSPDDCCGWLNDPMGAPLSLRTQGGSDCIIGLNCGPIRPSRPPPPTNPPRLAPRPQAAPSTEGSAPARPL